MTYALPKPLGAAAGVIMGRKKSARPMESVGVTAHIAGAAAARPTANAARVFCLRALLAPSRNNDHCALLLTNVNMLGGGDRSH